MKSELTVNPSEDNNVVTLTHTVSFYRRQQSKVNFKILNLRKLSRYADEVPLPFKMLVIDLSALYALFTW